MISLVIPVYNEESILSASVETLCSSLGDQFGDGFNIVAVDDGSQDRSLEILRELSEKYPLEVFENSINLGKGAAVRRGMLAAEGDFIFFTDTDLSTDLEHIESFHKALSGEFDAVIGNRKHSEAVIRTPQGQLRTIMGLGYTRFVNLLLGLDFSDYTCGFKGFTREAARAVFSRSVVNGWSFDAEILFLSRRFGFKVSEIPVTWDDRPNTKVHILGDTVRSFSEVVGIRLRAARGAYGD